MLIGVTGGYPVVPLEAPWDRLIELAHRIFYVPTEIRQGLRSLAGPLRNWMLVRALALTGGKLIAFPGGKGTRGCIAEAKRQGVEVVMIGGTE